MLSCDEMIELLQIIANFDIHSDLLWFSNEYNSIDFFVNVNDVFMWGCGDLESIECIKDINDLRNSIKDCRDRCKFGEDYSTILYACRKRKMRPQGAIYKNVLPKELWELFDEVGSSREVGFGNPYDREEL